MNEVFSDLWIVALVIFLITALVLLVAGARRKVVIYYDFKDLGLSFLTIVFPVIAWILFANDLFESAFFNGVVNWLVAPIFCLFSLAFLIECFGRAIIHNRSQALGLVVGVFKLVFVFLSFLVALGQIGKILESMTPVKETIIGAIILIGLYLLMDAMVNGEDVYAEKGWKLPETTA